MGVVRYLWTLCVLVVLSQVEDTVGDCNAQATSQELKPCASTSGADCVSKGCCYNTGTCYYDRVVTISTKAGTATAGTACFFPFTYEGNSYDSCTNINVQAGVSWCSTEPDYATNNKFGYCTDGVTPAPAPTPTPAPTVTPAPVTPAPGTGGCANVLSKKSCAVGAAFSSQQACESVGCCWDAAFIPNCFYNDVNMVGTCKAVVIDKIPQCALPFVYEGITYHSCITKDNGITPWCSTSPDYDAALPGSNKWCNCDQPTAATPTPTACSDVFSENKNKISLSGGTVVPSATSSVVCAAMCKADATCVGYNFWTSGQDLTQSCLIFTSVASILDIAGQVGSSVFTRDNYCCAIGGNTRFTKVDQTRSFGGVTQPSAINTAEECEQRCLTLGFAECVGFDFDRALTKCHIFSDYKSFTVTQEEVFTDHYPRLCDITAPTTPKICQDTYEDLIGKQSYGGEGMKGSKGASLETCKLLCSANDKCAAFDYDAASTEERCFSFEEFQPSTNIFNNDRITHVKRIERCAVATTPATGTPATTEVPVCDFNYIEFKNTGASDGTGIPSANDKDACEDKCDQNEECVGYDFDAENTATKCYHHLKVENLMKRYPSSSVNHYVKGSCPGTPTTQPPVTPDCENYTVQRNTFSHSGTRKGDVVDLQECKDECTAIDACLGFDWVPNFPGFKCFLHTDIASFVTLRQPVDDPQNPVDQYTKHDCEATVTPPTCADFIEYKGYFVYHGTLDSDTKDVDTCKSICKGDEACRALDFNTVDTACWIHKNNSNLNERFTNGAVNHYVKQEQCITTTPQATTITPVSPGCEIRYEVIAKKFWFKGIEQLNARSLSACEDVCTQDTNCKGVDFITMTVSGPICYTHTEANLKANGHETNDGNHYRKVEDCQVVTTPVVCDTFTEHKSFGAIGGSPINGNNEVAKCKEVCLADPSCVGFDNDVNNNGATCWTYDNATRMINDGFSRDNIDQYRLSTRCEPDKTTPGPTTAPGCSPVWKENENTNARDGTYTNASNSLDSCKAACIDNHYCIALDFNANSIQQCWLHIGPKNLTQGVLDGVNHYELVNRCEVPPPTTTSATGTTSAGTTVTTPSECEEFIEKPNHGADNGVLLSNINSTDACKVYCKAQPSCTGFDFNTANQCWEFRFTVDPSKITSRSHVTHYTKNQDCEVVGTTPDKCQTNWKKLAGTRGLAGTAASVQVADPESCKEQCLANSVCVAFDYHATNADKQYCWMFMNGNPTTSSEVNIDHYRLIERCIEETTAVSTVRTVPPCKDNFVMTPRTHYLHGILTPESAGGATRQSCERDCRNNGSCLGFDYNFDDLDCYLHFDPANFKIARPNLLVDHYRINRCTTGPPETTTTTTTTTTQATTTTTGTTTTTVTPITCQYDADVILLLDTSSSMNLDDLRNFASQFIAKLNIGREAMRLTIVTMGNTAEQVFDLDDTFDKQDMINRLVNKLTSNTLSRGTTNFDAALRLIQERKGAGNRFSTHDALIIVTDGTTGGFDITSTLNTMQNLKNSETRIIVATTRDENFLRSLATEGNNLYLAVQSINDQTVIDRLALEACTKPLLPQSCKTDLTFVVDESGSIRDKNIQGEEDNYVQILNFINSIISRLTIGSDDTRIAVVTFSNNATVKVRFNDYFNKLDLMAAVIRLNETYVRGNTNTSGGLYITRQHAFQSFNGDRHDVPNIAVVITDGVDTVLSGNVTEEAILLKREATVMSVGVTKDIDRDQLDTISTGDFTYTISQFNQLGDIIGRIVGGTCMTSNIPRK